MPSRRRPRRNAARRCAPARGAREGRKLARLPYHRAEYGEDVRRAVVPQSDHRRGRELAMHGIDDRAASGKRNVVGGRDLAAMCDLVSTATAPVCACRRRFSAGSATVASAPMISAWTAPGSASTSARAQPRSVGKHSRSVLTLDPDPVARDQVRRQSAGDPEADDARSAALGRPVEGSDKLRCVIAITDTPGPSAIRASSARQVTATTSP